MHYDLALFYYRGDEPYAVMSARVVGSYLTTSIISIMATWLLVGVPIGVKEEMDKKKNESALTEKLISQQ